MRAKVGEHLDLELVAGAAQRHQAVLPRDRNDIESELASPDYAGIAGNPRISPEVNSIFCRTFHTFEETREKYRQKLQRLIRNREPQLEIVSLRGTSRPTSSAWRRSSASRSSRLRRLPARRRRRRLALPIFDKISAKCCSFSAVSAPIFATKYAFCSIFQNLPDSQAEIFEI